MNEQMPPLLVCDVTQSYSPKGGGGITTYLAEKRRYVLERTPHRLLQIVPGPEDKVVQDGRHTWIEVASEPVRDSANYHFITRTRSVRAILERYKPDIIESMCPWLLPWTCIRHRRAHPGTTLVAGYHTDFPDAQVYRVARNLWGHQVARVWRMLAMGYAEITYREFDRVYVLGQKGADVLEQCSVEQVDRIDLGVDTRLFHPSRRDPAFRAGLGLPARFVEGNGPLLVYAGRIDLEKCADRLVEMMRHMPRELNAALVMIGDGKLHDRLRHEAEADRLPIAFTGFQRDRAELARALASSDIYVSAMADETFGVSIIEAQASGLPVVGVASGAMPERVTPRFGMLGPVDDVATMARNVEAIWRGDHAAIGRAARTHAETRYDWSRTFDRLFGEVYPAALERSRDRLMFGEKWRMSNLITYPVSPLLAWGGGFDETHWRAARPSGRYALGSDTFEPG